MSEFGYLIATGSADLNEWRHTIRRYSGLEQARPAIVQAVKSCGRIHVNISYGQLARRYKELEDRLSSDPVVLREPKAQEAAKDLMVMVLFILEGFLEVDPSLAEWFPILIDSSLFED